MATSETDEEQPNSNNDDSQHHDYDSMLTKVGEFGRFQCVLYGLSLIVHFSLGLDLLGFVFLSNLPDHWCEIPEFERLNLTEEQQKWISLPMDTEKEPEKYSECLMYDRNYSILSDGEAFRLANQSNITLEATTVGCQHGWLYDFTDGRDSFVAEWDLVCSKRFLAGVTQTAFMAGVVVGGLVSGGVADRFGRRPTVIVCSVIRFAACLLCVAVANVWIYTMLRFVVAAFGFSAATALFIINMELVGVRWRKDVGVARDLFWVASFLVVAGLAYLIPHWRHLQLALGLLTIPNFAVLIILPESPRWLYAKGRKVKAQAVLARIARWNGRCLEKDKGGMENGLDCNVVVSQEKVYMWDIFRYRRLLKRVFIICFTWFAGDLVYYGISLNSVYLGSNPYLSFALSGLIEAPAYIFCILALDRLGRRPIVISMMACSGLALVISSALPSTYQSVLVGLSTTVKFCVTAAYSALYVYTVEFFPTLVRTSGVGFASFVGRLGGLVAPQVALLIEDYSSILLGVFGGLSLLSSILVVFLPETTNTALADTLEDTEDRKKTKTTCVNIDKSETCHKGQEERTPSDQECDTEH